MPSWCTIQHVFPFKKKARHTINHLFSSTIVKYTKNGGLISKNCDSHTPSFPNKNQQIQNGTFWPLLGRSQTPISDFKKKNENSVCVCLFFFCSCFFFFFYNYFLIIQLHSVLIKENTHNTSAHTVCERESETKIATIKRYPHQSMCVCV